VAQIDSAIASIEINHNALVDFPERIEPMSDTLTQERFTGPEWVFERKFDGIRLLAFRQGHDVRLLSRNRLPQNCPPVAQGAAATSGVRDHPRWRNYLGPRWDKLSCFRPLVARRPRSIAVAARRASYVTAESAPGKILRKLPRCPSIFSFRSLRYRRVAETGAY
jgi:hypothetical protein